jgi:hypothetical protein
MERTKEIEPIILNQVAQTEKYNEKTAANVIDKLAKHSIIVRKGTTFLIIFSVLALYAAVYLIHMETINRHFQSPVYKTAAR